MRGGPLRGIATGVHQCCHRCSQNVDIRRVCPDTRVPVVEHLARNARDGRHLAEMRLRTNKQRSHTRKSHIKNVDENAE